MADEMHLARLVRIVREGSMARLEVDGVEFPWLISARAVIDCSTGDVPSVEITLLAERVEMANSLDPPEPPCGCETIHG